MMSIVSYKYAVFSALAIMLVGCTDSLLDDKNGSDANKQAGTCYYNAYIDNGQETRTSMGDLSDDKYPVLWSEGDRVLFGYGSYDSDKEELELINGAGTTKAVFRGRTWADITKVGLITGIYPANGAKYNYQSWGNKQFDDKSEANKKNITLTAVLPNIQTYQAGTFAPNVLPMIGLCENKADLYFENYGGVLQLPVKGNGKISKIILTGNDGEILAGEFNVNCYFWEWTKSKGGYYIRNPYWTVDYRESEISSDDKDAACGRLITPVSSNSYGMVIVDCGEDGLQLDPTTPTMINIAILPKTFKKGFSVKFIDYDNGGSFEKSTTQSITVKRSYVKTMEAFDYQTPEPLEPANCYVVDKTGYFMIPAFCMGNRPKSARLDVDENGNYNVTGNPVEADYLWTDVDGAISNIEYIPGKDGYISFKVNADKSGNAPRGNTVIALYDSVTKEILWSWHIWMSEYNEVKTNGTCRAGESTIDGFISEASKKSLIIMDRNLGAVSADKNDGWKTYGLYYQMGRKDPFIGGKINGGPDQSLGEHSDNNHKDSNIPNYDYFETTAFGENTNSTKWNTNLTSGWNYVSEYITAIYGYKHPMDFASTWNAKSSGDTRWTTKELNKTEPFVSNGKHEDFWNRSKTINDPCPAGWTMLGEDGKLYDTPTSQEQYFTDGVYGIEAVYTLKDGTSSTVWWPASGFRSVDGTLGNIGLGGYYWWFDHIDAQHGGHGSFFYKEANKGIYKTGTGVMTNHASSVRCVKAKQSED